MTDAESIDGADTAAASGVSAHLESALEEELEARDAAAVAHVGPADEPAIRYCLSALGSDSGRGSRSGSDGGTDTGTVAVAFDGEWTVRSSDDTSSHPADALASALADRAGTESESGTGTILTPARVPHDAALYLERGEFDLASTDIVARARATKTPAEREHIAAAQAAAGAGVRRGASLLAATADDDGRLMLDGEALTANRLRRAVDETIVSAGAFPAGNTVVDSAGWSGDEALRAGEPIVLEAAPCGPDGYHGGLVRTFVVDGDGGPERRAHVGVTQSFRSAAAMLTADAESVTAVEADLEAEVRAFGFGETPDEIRTRASGVGLEPRERPLAGGDRIESGSVVRLESAVRLADDRWLRIADLLVKGETGERATYLEAPSRSLDPKAVLE